MKNIILTSEEKNLLQERRKNFKKKSKLLTKRLRLVDGINPSWDELWRFDNYHQLMDIIESINTLNKL